MDGRRFDNVHVIVWYALMHREPRPGTRFILEYFASPQVPSFTASSDGTRITSYQEANSAPAKLSS